MVERRLIGGARRGYLEGMKNPSFTLAISDSADNLKGGEVRRQPFGCATKNANAAGKWHGDNFLTGSDILKSESDSSVSGKHIEDSIWRGVVKKIFRCRDDMLEILGGSAHLFGSLSGNLFCLAVAGTGVE